MLAAPPAAAQNIGRTTGVLTGVVQDESGGVLPGVILTATSPALVGTQTAVSDGAGVFNLPGLPAGSYRLAAELQGFSPAVAENVELRVGETLKVGFTLKLGGLETVVQVEAPLISVVSSERSQDFTAAEFSELPKGRTWETLVEQAPSINTEGLSGQTGLSFQGASVNENVYIVDGMDTTRVTTGVSGQPVVFEFVDTIQVKSGFVGAEYGGALGGIVNVTTRSGANQFHGFGTMQFSGSAVTARPRPRLRINPTVSTIAEYIDDPEDNVDQWDVGGALGGPVSRDRLWFFGGYVPTLTNTSRDVTFISTRETASFENRTRSHYGTAKLTWRASDALKLNAGYLALPFTVQGVLPGYDGTASPNQPFAELGSRQPQHTYSATADWVATSRLFVNASAGYLVSTFRDVGIPNVDRVRYVTSSIGLAGVPASFQGPAGFETFGNNIRTDKSDTTRVNAGVVGTLAFNAAGPHTFKAGVQFAAQDWVRLGGYTGKRIDVHWNAATAGQRGTLGYWRWWENTSDGQADSTNLALFVQDSWTLSPRLTVNAGLRFEREKVHPYTAQADTATGDIVFGFGEKLAPRIGAAWDVRGDARWKIYANGGLFYDTLKLSVPGQAYGGAIFRITYFTLETFDWTTLTPETPSGRQFLVQNLQGLPAVTDPDIKPTRTTEFAVGSEYQLASDVVVGIQYSRRSLTNAIENFIIGDPRRGAAARRTAVANPGRGIVRQPYGPDFATMPEFERTYDGLELLVQKRMSRRWLGSVSYTYSKLYGNYEGLGDSDEQAFGGGAINANRYCDFLEGCFTAAGTVDEGRLTLDRPHQFKANGFYLFPFGLSVGGYFRAVSGTIATRQIGVNSASPVHPDGRGSDGRTDPLTQADLLLQWRLPVGRGTNATVSLNVINLFNQDTVTSLFPAMLNGASTAIVVPPQDWFAGRVNYDALIAAQGTLRDPRFLLPQRFQAPRALRVGIRFDF
jgi:outer membrane receptor protein involved in Fe transport